MMESRQLQLNERQRYVVAMRKIPEKAFEGQDEFNSYAHVAAFDYLCDHKQLTYQEALQTLAQLNADQAEGILQGLSKATVLGLTKVQINAVLKFGLKKEEVRDLNQYQLHLFLKLRHLGLTTDSLRKNPWLATKEYSMAFGFLVTRKQYASEAAFNLLSTLSRPQAVAICSDIDSNATDNLEDYAIDTLIAAKKYQGLQTKTEVEKLNPIHIKIVADLFHWGVLSDNVRPHDWLQSDKHHQVLCYLIKECFFEFNNAMTEIEALNEQELEGILLGLCKKEVKGLNTYQIKALYQCKTAFNGLTGDLFKNKPWFDSESHVEAFYYLINYQYFSPERALKELDGLNSNAAQAIQNGQSREEIVGLNQWMLAVIQENAKQGLAGKHLRGKHWFDSDLQVTALNRLIASEGKFKEEMLNFLEKMNHRQLILISDGISPDKLTTLTDMQLRILIDIRNGLFSLRREDVENATWLSTEDQYEAFVLLDGKIRYDKKHIFTILMLASNQKRIGALIEELRDPEASLAFEKDFRDIKQLPFFSSYEITDILATRPVMSSSKAPSGNRLMHRMYQAVTGTGSALESEKKVIKKNFS